jgi:hypothetical protein
LNTKNEGKIISLPSLLRPVYSKASVTDEIVEVLLRYPTSNSIDPVPRV